MTDQTALGYEPVPPHRTEQMLREVFRTGAYTIVLRWDDNEQIVTSEREIEASYQPGSPQPGVVLYEPRHLYVRPDDVPGGRCQLGESEATLDLDLDGDTATVIDLVPVPLVPGAFYGRLSDDDPDARTVVDRLQELAAGDPAGVALSHGFRLWAHIGWFSHIGWFGDAQNVGSSNQPAPTNFPSPPPDDADPTAAIGLIDVGVDTGQVWLQDKLIGDKPTGWKESDSHGTQVAGVLRQAAPGSPIYAERVVHQAHVVQEQQIIAALGKLADNVNLVVMSFGGETLSDWQALGDAITTYLGGAAGRTVFAAAGNLFPPDPDDPDSDGHNDDLVARRIVYPAGFANVRAVAGGPITQFNIPPTQAGPTDSASYYSWSNGGDWVTDVISVTNSTRTGGYLFTSYLTNPIDPGTGQPANPGGPDANEFAVARGTSLLVPIAAAMALGRGNPFPASV